MVELRNISLALGGRPVLQDLNLAVAAGELCVLMGANGAGKSTLLKVMAGEYIHYQGDVRLAGEPLQQLSTARLARCRAVLSQQVSLQLPFTVNEIVQMGRYAYRDDPAKDAAIAGFAMETLQVDGLKNRSWTTLSGGQQQRVQMARVLAQILESPSLDMTGYHNRKMLLLDEPVTGMDIRHQQQALQLAATLAGMGVLVIAVLHDFQLAAAYAHRLCLLHQGKIYAGGTVAEVLTAENIRRCFDAEVAVLQHPHCDHPIVIPASSLTKKHLIYGNDHHLA